MPLLYLAAFLLNTLDGAFVTAGVKDLLAALLAVFRLHRGLNLASFWSQWHVNNKCKSLAAPRLSGPVVCRELIPLTLDAARPSAVAFLTPWITFLNRHVRITEADDLLLAVSARFHDRFFPALYVAPGAVTW